MNCFYCGKGFKYEEEEKKGGSKIAKREQIDDIVEDILNQGYNQKRNWDKRDVWVDAILKVCEPDKEMMAKTIGELYSFDNSTWKHRTNLLIAELIIKMWREDDR